MSKKTEQIYKGILKLEDLKNQISIINQLAKSKIASEISENERAEQTHHLENIEFEMSQAINSLKFWISSLYSYNGKSTSNAKKSASRENGKKGGRPPKEITNLKKRKIELEETVIPELKREKSITTDLEKEEKISSQISAYENELSEIEIRLDEYHKR